MTDNILLTHEQEISLAKDVEAGCVADYKSRNKDPYDAVYDSSSFNEDSVIYDIVHRVRDNESSPLVDVLNLDNDDTLLRAYADRGIASRDEFLTHNTRLVFSYANRYANQGCELDDLIQEGNIALIHAVKKFDWRSGNKFSSYAVWWLRQGIDRSLKTSARTIRIPVHMESRIRLIRQAYRDIGENADISDLAAYCDCRERDIVDALKYNRITRVISSDTPVDANDGISMIDMIPGYCDVWQQTENIDEQHRIVAMLASGLSTTEYQSVVLLNGIGCEKMPMQYIGRRLHVSARFLHETQDKAKNLVRQYLSK